MSGANAGRTVVAILASYLAFGIVVGATEQLLSSPARSQGGALPHSYFVIDLISQCFYAVAAGYLCHVIAPSPTIALRGLIGIGLVVGTVSLISSWKAEPHWYAIALLGSYAPCVWIGWAFRSRLKTKSTPEPVASAESEKTTAR